MALYPSLENLKIGEITTTQSSVKSQYISIVPECAIGVNKSLYPSLSDYMGLDLNMKTIETNVSECTITGGELLTLCKDKNGKVGLRVHAVQNGIFVCLVSSGSPAAKSGLRFGDQILDINGTSVAGYSMDQVHRLLQNTPVNNIKIIVRDRPFERIIVMHKDSSGHIGFQFKDGRIISVVKNSSAAKNGVLTDHQILEVNGKNVIGLKDKDIVSEIKKCFDTVIITVIPSYIFDHIVQKMAGNILKLMSYSGPSI